MRFSTLTCFALTATTLLQPVISSYIEPSTALTFGESEPARDILYATSEIGEEYAISSWLRPFIDWSAIVRRLLDLLHYTHARDYFWDIFQELGPKFQGRADELFHHATQLQVYPAEKITEFKASVDSITGTATTLQKILRNAAEQHENLFDSLKERLGDILEELKEQFPPPHDAPSHDNRTVMITTFSDRIEEGFLQFATEHGVDEEHLRSHTSSFKSHFQSIVVTICDLVEQHEELAITLLVGAVVLLLPELWLLRQVLLAFGFGPRGPIKGGVAAWLQRWLFGASVPKGGWFAMLQHLAMKALKH